MTDASAQPSWRTRLGSWVLRQLGNEALGTLFSVVGGQRTGQRRLGTAELIAAYRVSPWFRAVVSKIATKIAAIPWKLFVKVDDSGEPVRSMALQNAGFELREKMMAELKEQGNLIEIESHPLLDLLNNPNPEMTGLTFRKLVQIYLDIKGEVFAVIERSPAGVPLELWPIPPNWVQDIPDSINKAFVVQSPGGQRADIPPEDMIWFRDPDPANPYSRGIGIGESLGDEIETDEFAAKFVKTFFMNRGKPELLISVEGASDVALERAKREFDDRHRGFWKAHRPWWTSGRVEVKELQQKFTDMEFQELRAWERDAFIIVFGVPPEIMGLIENSNRATIKESRSIMATEVIVPRMEFLRTEIQSRLVNAFDDRLILGFESPVPEDRDFKLDALQAAPHMATRGEWRRFQGLPDRGEEDNIHLTPLNLFPEQAPPLPEVMRRPTHRQLQGALGRKQLPSAKVIAETDIPAILMAIETERLARDLRPLWSEQLLAWGNRTLEDLGLDPTFNMANPAVIEHLNNFSANRIGGINATTIDAVQGQLAEGVALGEGVPDLARRVESVFDAARGARSTTIARTEVIRSSGFGTLDSYRQSGIVEGKQWITTLDGEQRDEHDDLNGQIVGIDEPFRIAGAEALHPGDFGVAELDINCRCTLVAIIEDRERSREELDAIWRQFDREAQIWERATVARLRPAFADQLEAVLAALEAADQ